MHNSVLDLIGTVAMPSNDYGLAGHRSLPVTVTNGGSGGALEKTRDYALYRPEGASWHAGQE